MSKGCVYGVFKFFSETTGLTLIIVPNLTTMEQASKDYSNSLGHLSFLI